MGGSSRATNTPPGCHKIPPKGCHRTAKASKGPPEKILKPKIWGDQTLSILTGNRGKPHQKKCYRIVMNPEGLPHNPDAAERVIQKYLKLMSLHRELASLYRTKSRDRRTIANLWYYIDGLEIDLRAEGVKL